MGPMESSDIVQITILIVSLLFSMTLHEMMHAFTAHWLGDDTAEQQGRLTLNPLAHIDPILTIAMPVLLALTTGIPIGAAKPVPFNPARVKYGDFGAAIVAAAGPFTNFFLAVFSGLWLRFIIGFDAGLLSEAFMIFMIMNLSFFVFNLVPMPPLDGSRILYAVAPEGMQRVMRQIEQFGIFAIILFITVLYPFIGPIITNTVENIASFILGISFSF